MKTKIKAFYSKLAENRVFKIAITTIAILFSVFVLGGILYQQRENLLSFKWNLQPYWIFILLILYIIGILIVVWVWHNILQSIGFSIGFWNNFRFFIISNIAKRLPGTVWYIFWRSEIYKKYGLNGKVITLASAMEMAVSTIAGVLVSFVFAISWLYKLNANLWWIIGLLFITSIIFLHPKMINFFIKIIGIDLHEINMKHFIIWIIAYVFVWIIGGGILFSATSFIYPIAFNVIKFYIGAWSLIGILSLVLFFLPTNFGFTEIGLSLLLSLTIPGWTAVLTAIILRVLLLGIDILLASACWFFELRKHEI